jgi:hypothetical protein
MRSDPNSSNFKPTLRRQYLIVRKIREQYAIGRQKAYDLINSSALVTALVDGAMRGISVDSAEALFQSSHHAPTRPGLMTGKMGAGPGGRAPALSPDPRRRHAAPPRRKDFDETPAEPEVNLDA